MLQFLFSFLALVIAFLIVFIIPEFSQWDNVVAVIAAIAGVFGVNNWYRNLEKWKEWYNSDTLTGAIIATIAIVAVSVIQFFGLEIPGVIETVLAFIVAASGGELLGGARDAGEK